MKSLINSGPIAVMLLIIAFSVNAQKKSEVAIQNQWVPSIIDANHSEWGDSLKYYDEDTRFRYSIANDDKNIYLAIAVQDKQRIQNIISGGITFFINTEGKKKEGQAVVFPVISAYKPLKKSTPEEAVRQTLQSTKAIKVAGFKKILDGNISVTNDFGIHAIASLAESGTLLYEAAIPLERLNLTTGTTKELNINIRLNIPDSGPRISRMYETPYETQRRRNRGDYSAPQSRTIVTTSDPAGFWVKRTLAKMSLAK